MIPGRGSTGNTALRLAGFASIAVFFVTIYLFSVQPRLFDDVQKQLSTSTPAVKTLLPNQHSDDAEGRATTSTVPTTSASPSSITNQLSSTSTAAAQATETQIRKAIIAVSTKENDVSWMKEYVPDWQANIYVMDDPTANLTVEQNKGNEGAAYLTYLIDNYNNLPDIMVFIHALRYQWHNDDPMYDHVPVLRNLQLPHVREHGYVNLRCTWDIGCPRSIEPTADDAPDFAPYWPFTNLHKAWTLTFKDFFPGEPLPERVGAPCCAQFAMSKEKVRERTVEDYKRYRNWLWTTGYESMVSGRIMEYMWHSKPIQFLCT